MSGRDSGASRVALVAGVCSLLALQGCSRDAARPAKQTDSRSADVGILQTSWSANAAESYLDQREKWWIAWSTAARDRGTFCISCHTSVPYILARSAVRTASREKGLSSVEQALFDNTTRRVRLWNEIEPYYADTALERTESRATEAVLNALVLASRDSQTGKLRDDTRTALSNMWSLQITSGKHKGAWLWQQFGLNPWENADSVYFGATLAALAVATAPERYSALPEVQDHLNLLRAYLVREFPTQSLLNKTYALWASTKLPKLLEPERQKSLIGEVLEKQEPDGGWNLYGLTLTWSWKSMHLSSILSLGRRADETKQETGSDGLATGLAVFVLQEAGVDKNSRQLKRGLSWLVANQNKDEGSWAAASLNKRRDPSSNVGRFMSDAATAYALMALNKSID